MRIGTLLITGCGGDIPIALARIARPLSDRLIGTDIHSDHAGPAFFDECNVVPRADDPDYLKSLASIVKSRAVDAVVIGSEAELRALMDVGVEGAFEGAPLITANREALRVGLDKWTTNKALGEGGLPVPWTALEPIEYPCIGKARQGTGSRTVHLVSSEDQAKELLSKGGYIFQEHLLPDDQEYTCGLYRTWSGEVRTLVLKRWLQGGFTGRGEVVQNEQIEASLFRIAEIVDLRGSINVQLRLTEAGPMVFEINPRFSSTVMFRHKLGFQDFVWSLREASGLETGAYQPPAVGTKIFRVSDEVILS